MSLPGTEAVRILQRGARKAKRTAELVGGEFDGVQQRILSAVEQRGQAVSALARHYLPTLDDGHIDSVFGDVRNELEMLQVRQRTEIEALDRALVATADRRAAREHELEAVNTQLEVKVEARTALQGRVAEMLSADSEFQRLTNEVAHATARLERDEGRAAELHGEAKLKLPAYERSRLFRYLLERNFGSPDYTARGFTRRMDRFVANLIGWSKAKPGYDFLRATPELVALEVERRKEEFDARMVAVENHERSAAAAVGLDVVMREGEELGRRRDSLLAALDEAMTEESRLRQQLTDAASSTGRFHAEALQRLRTDLDRTSAAVLRDRALGTPDPTDDRLVAELRAADGELDQLRARTAALGTQREESQRRATELQRLVDDLRRRECDSVRCRFESMAPFTFEQRIEAIVDGREDTTTLAHDLENVRRFESKSLRSSGGDHPPSGGGGEFPWWLLHAMGAVADVALRGAMSRGIGRHSRGSSSWSGSSGSSSCRSSGSRSSGSRSSGGRSSSGSSGPSAGRFTRGKGF